MAEQKQHHREQRWSLKGMNALVAGGTRGIGYAIVEELTGFGAEVHTRSRNQKQLNERIQEWKSKGFRVSGSVCDLNSRDQREKLIQSVSSVYDGKLNILVSIYIPNNQKLYCLSRMTKSIYIVLSRINNAAIVLLKDYTNYTFEDYAMLMSSNVESPHHLCQLAYPPLKASGNASIVFISSIGGIISLPKISVYAATKGAINQMTRSLACEWAKDRIPTNSVAPWGVKTTMSQEHVNISERQELNAIAPGIIRTSLIDAAIMQDSEFEEIVNKIITQTPMLRPGLPNEVSSVVPVVAFLCSPAASYITG